MVNIMFEVPSRGDVQSCTITADAVSGKKPPELKLKKKAVRKSA
jgi:ATP-dependent protease Clp ATPase subunit